MSEDSPQTNLPPESQASAADRETQRTPEQWAKEFARQADELIERANAVPHEFRLDKEGGGIQAKQDLWGNQDPADNLTVLPSGYKGHPFTPGLTRISRLINYSESMSGKFRHPSEPNGKYAFVKSDPKDLLKSNQSFIDTQGTIPGSGYLKDGPLLKLDTPKPDQFGLRSELVFNDAESDPQQAVDITKNVIEIVRRVVEEAEARQRAVSADAAQ